MGKELERIIEILLFVLAEYEKTQNPADIDVSSLLSQGYTDIEISTAFSWLYDNYYSKDSAKTKTNTFRILHDTERVLFTHSAWADIQQMLALGLLSNEDIENIIEKASFGGQNKIDSKHVRNFVAYNLFYSKPDNSNKVFLNGNETIN